VFVCLSALSRLFLIAHSSTFSIAALILPPAPMLPQGLHSIELNWPVPLELEGLMLLIFPGSLRAPPMVGLTTVLTACLTIRTVLVGLISVLDALAFSL